MKHSNVQKTRLCCPQSLALAVTLFISSCADQGAQATRTEVFDDRSVSPLVATVNTTEHETQALELKEVLVRDHASDIEQEPTRRAKNLFHERKMGKATNEVSPAYMLSTQGHYQPQPQMIAPTVDRENYLAFERNAIEQVANRPVSTFSIDVDTAAYSNIRRLLQREGRLPPRHAVKVEEMLNYFEYQYPQPEHGRPFSVTTELAQSPWNSGRQLLQIGIQGFKPPPQQRPAANLVFLVDVSGSMRSADKLDMVKKSLRLLSRKLRGNDRIALVAYAGAAGLVLESTAASNQVAITQAIDSLAAGGSTNGGAGIELAYQQAKQHYIEGGINRVLIASDGDMNVGMASLEALKELISEKRKSGISLTTLGFGTGNYNYALMEQLADNGDGNAAYIDSLQEAQKVLVQQLNATLHTIARDVKVQIEFNPELVSEYRLIGYENRMLKREDFRNDTVDAGDIGAGHTVTALYEITPANKSSAQSVAPLRYKTKKPSGEKEFERSKPQVNKGETQELAYVRLRYKTPGSNSSIELAQAIEARESAPALGNTSENMRFATSVAGFGGLLAGGKYIGSWSFEDTLQLARTARGNDPHGYRGEFVRLVELAQSLSENQSVELGREPSAG